METKKTVIGQAKILCRLSYVYLAEARKPAEDADPKFSVQCRIPKSDEATIKVVRKAIKDAVVEKFGPDSKKWPLSFRKEDFFKTHLSPDGRDGFFLRDGAGVDGDDSYNDEVFFKASNKSRPRCGYMVGQKWKELHDVEEIREKIYSGCYAYVVFQAFGYESNGSKGVGASLGAVVFMKDGERIGGNHVDMGDLFGEEASDEELLAGADDLDDI